MVFYLWAIINNSAVNIGIQGSVQVPASNSFGCMPRSGAGGSYDDSIPSFLRKCQTVFPLVDS